MSQGFNQKEQDLLQQLMDYQFGLDMPEQRALTQALIERDPQAADMLERLSGALKPLESLQAGLSDQVSLADATYARIKAHQQAQSIAAGSAKIATGAESAPTDRGRIRFVAWNLRNGLAAAAAILILFLIGQPGMDYMRQRSYDTACASQLRLVSQAFSEYAQAHDGYMPYVPNQPGDVWWSVGETGEENHSNTRNLFLMVKTGYVSPEDLFCPSVPRESTNPKMLELDAQTLAELKDFMCRNSVNYSICWLFEGRPTRFEDCQRKVIMADKNPVFAQVDCHSKPTKVPAKGESCQKNSPNHKDRGQNVLFSDGQVVFLTTRVLPNTQDDIYMIADAPAAYTGTERPASPNDEFVAP